MNVFAIDPGSTESAFVLFDGARIQQFGKCSNEMMLYELAGAGSLADIVVIEMIASYGMPVGKEVFETCVWIGRFMEASGVKVHRVYRKDIKLRLCGTFRAKDGNIRQALIDKYGAPGTKKAPGMTYGISKDVWAALAVADYALSPSPKTI